MTYAGTRDTEAREKRLVFEFEGDQDIRMIGPYCDRIDDDGAQRKRRRARSLYLEAAARVSGVGEHIEKGTAINWASGADAYDAASLFQTDQSSTSIRQVHAKLRCLKTLSLPCRRGLLLSHNTLMVHVDPYISCFESRCETFQSTGLVTNHTTTLPRCTEGLRKRHPNPYGGLCGCRCKRWSMQGCIDI